MKKDILVKIEIDSNDFFYRTDLDYSIFKRYVGIEKICGAPDRVIEINIKKDYFINASSEIESFRTAEINVDYNNDDFFLMLLNYNLKSKKLTKSEFYNVIKNMFDNVSFYNE